VQGKPNSERSKSRKAEEALLQGALAQMVFEEASQKLPDDVLLRQRFLQIASDVPCPGIERLQERIFDEMVTSFESVRFFGGHTLLRLNIPTLCAAAVTQNAARCEVYIPPTLSIRTDRKDRVLL
jgi:hypothetical protein